MKVVANFYVLAIGTYCDLRLNAGSEKCWVWTAQDYSEGEQVVEQFALKFGTAELAKAFKDAFDNAKSINSKLDCFKDLDHGCGKEQAQAEKAAAASPKLRSQDFKAEKAATAPPQLTSQAPEAGSLFGGLGGGLSGGGLFSGSSSSATTGGGLFGSSNAEGSIFGNLSTSGSIFGGSSEGGIFGSSNTSSSSIFGPTPGGIFGSPAANSNSTFAGLGGGMVGGTSAIPATNGKEPEEQEEDDDDDGYDYEEYYPQEHDMPETGASAGGSLAWMAQQQASSGWRCPGCRLQWPEATLECSVCEIPKPGQEQGKEKAQADKAKGQADAVAAFLGTGSSASQAPQPTGFGVKAASPAAPAAFSKQAAVPSTSSIFGVGSCSSSIFGSSAAATGNMSSSIFGPQSQGTPSTPPVSAQQGAAVVVPPLFQQPDVSTFGAFATAAQQCSAGGMFQQPPPPPQPVQPKACFVPGGAFGAPAQLQVPLAPAAPMPAAASLPPSAASATITAPGAASTPAAVQGLDASVLLEVIKAITVAQQGAGAMQVTAASSGPNSARNSRTGEEALRKSEEAMRKTEDLLRRMQDEAERARSAEQQTRRLEDQVESQRRQQQQAETNHRQQVDLLRDELRREREERSSFEAKHSATIEVLQVRLDAAQKTAGEALKLVEDKKMEHILERIELFENKVEQRFDAWETMSDKRKAGDGMRALPPSTIGSRIQNLNSLHMQQTGRRITDCPGV